MTIYHFIHLPISNKNQLSQPYKRCYGSYEPNQQLVNYINSSVQLINVQKYQTSNQSCYCHIFNNLVLRLQQSNYCCYSQLLIVKRIQTAFQYQLRLHFRKVYLSRSSTFWSNFWHYFMQFSDSSIQRERYLFQHLFAFNNFHICNNVYINIRSTNFQILHWDNCRNLCGYYTNVYQRDNSQRCGSLFRNCDCDKRKSWWFDVICNRVWSLLMDFSRAINMDYNVRFKCNSSNNCDGLHQNQHHIRKSDILFKKIQKGISIINLFSNIRARECLKYHERKVNLSQTLMNELRQSFINRKTKKVNFCRREIAISIHLPVLRKMTGYLVIVLSSAALINSIDPSIQRQSPIIFSSVYFISCFMSNILVKFFSRRTSFQIGTVSACILNLMLSVGFYFQINSAFAIALKVTLIIIYGMTLGPLVWPYLPQVVPARIIPLAQTMNWVIDCLTLTLPPIILTHVESASPLFFIFFAWDFLSIIVNHFLIIQTKRKSVAQIMGQLQKQD